MGLVAEWFISCDTGCRECGAVMVGWRDPEVIARVERLDIAFNVDGYDRYGISRDHLVRFLSALKPVYEHWSRVTSFDTGNVPTSGRAILAGNHSGGVGFDALMVLCSLVFDREPPRLAHGMMEQSLAKIPFANTVFSRMGQFSGYSRHAEHLLEDERLLLVFPEGPRGSGKLFRERYQLARFGTGFMRLALKTKSPVIPFAFVGAEEAFPALANAKWLAKLFGASYLPITPQLVPLPLPLSCQVYYGEPMYFEGTGNESDEVVAELVSRVRNAVQRMVDRGCLARPTSFMLQRMPGEDESLVGGRR